MLNLGGYMCRSQQLNALTTSRFTFYKEVSRSGLAYQTPFLAASQWGTVGCALAHVCSCPCLKLLVLEWFGWVLPYILTLLLQYREPKEGGIAAGLVVVPLKAVVALPDKDLGNFVVRHLSKPVGKGSDYMIRYSSRPWGLPVDFSQENKVVLGSWMSEWHNLLTSTQRSKDEDTAEKKVSTDEPADKKQKGM